MTLVVAFQNSDLQLLTRSPNMTLTLFGVLFWSSSLLLPLSHDLKLEVNKSKTLINKDLGFFEAAHDTQD